jgi:phosphohistidine phosphatase
VDLPDLRLFLVHHGEALPAEVDPMRPLSAEGREAVLRLASQIAGRQVKPRAIWQSGKLRARQTGEAFRDACNPAAEFRTQAGLRPEDGPERIEGSLQTEEGELMIVGHMPHLRRLLTRLLGTSERESFPMNGAVALERVGGRWRELWRVSPADPHQP